MIDPGNQAVGRRSNTKLAKLSNTVQDMMQNWTEDNFAYFTQVMDVIREGAPVQWVKLYMEAVKLGIEKNTNINITIDRQQDRANLQALVRSRIPLPQTGSYTPYEEIKTKEVEHIAVLQQPKEQSL